MRVGELKKLLEKYPDDMEVIGSLHSDYCLIDERNISVVKAVANNSWLMRSHPTMSEENKAKEMQYLHIA